MKKTISLVLACYLASSLVYAISGSGSSLLSLIESNVSTLEKNDGSSDSKLNQKSAGGLRISDRKSNHTSLSDRFSSIDAKSSVAEVDTVNYKSDIRKFIEQIEGKYVVLNGFDAIIGQLQLSVAELNAMLESAEDQSVIKNKADELTALLNKALEVKDKYCQLCDIVKKYKELYTVTGNVELGNAITQAEVLVNAKATLTTESLGDIENAIQAIELVKAGMNLLGTKVWDFNISPETIAGLAYDSSHFGNWSVNGNYYRHSSSSSNWSQLYYYGEGTVRDIPETEGIYFYNGGYRWYIYTDGSNRLFSYSSGSSYAFMIPNLTTGQIVTINYSTGNNGSTRGITRYSDNTALVSGQDRTTETAEVSYEVTMDGDVSFYPYNGAIYINSISLTVPGDPLRLAELRMEVAEYIATLDSFPGLKSELQVAYNNAVITEEESDVENIIDSLKNTLNNVKKAIDVYPMILADIESANAALAEEAYVDLSEAVAQGNAIDVNTSNSAGYIAAFDALETALAIYNSDKVEMSDWAFNTSSVYTVDGLRYYLDTTHNLAEFINFNNSNAYSGVLSIPATIRYNGTTYAVVAMINNGRYTQSNITSITLPKSLRYIGDYGLGYFSNVRSIEIPENVTSMGSDVFYGSSNLTSIKMNAVVPPTISSMNGNSHKKVTVPLESFHAYRIADGWKDCVIIGGDGVTVHTGKIAAGDLGYVVIDEATSLQEVNKLIIDEGTLNNDDWNSIKSMTNLIEIDMSGLTMSSLPSNAFDGKWAMEKVFLPKNLISIGDYAFRGCNSLKQADLNEGLQSIGIRAFQSTALEELVLPNSLNKIGDYAFENYNNAPTIRKVKCGDQLESIGYGAFQYQSKLEMVDFNETLSNIGSSAFSRCGIRNLEIPKALKTIKEDTFYGNATLESVTFHEGLQAIYYNAFYGCNSLTDVVLPSSLEICQDNPFNYCTGIKRMEVRAVLPPYTAGDCPLANVNLSDVTLVVPSWSVSEYQMALGWSSFMDLEASNYMPQNIKVNKDFHFTLRDTLETDYRPNISMTYSDVVSTDAYGYSNYERGNLTVSGRSKLAVNDFSFVVSPYAKYYADENVRFNYNYDYNRTRLNSTSLIVNGEMRAENVTMSLCNYNSRWQFVTFPFDVKVSDIVPQSENTSWVIRGHNSAMRAAGKTDSVWVNLTAEDVLEAGKGYIMHNYNPNYFSYNGSNYSCSWFDVSPIKNTVNRQLIFSSGDRTVQLEENLAEFDHNRSWNLIGNPYPCFYDSRFMDFDAPFMVWNSYNQNYVAYNPADDAYILSPGEAFFVQRPFEQESITFRKEGRQTHRYAREMEVDAPARAKAVSSNVRTIYNLTLKQDSLTDRTRVVFNEAASLKYDMSKDAAKFASTDRNVPQIFTIADKTRYAINERPFATGDVALGVYCGVEGELTISIDKTYGCKVILEDRLAKKFVELSADNSYTFTAFAGEDLARFVLHFENDATGVDDIHVDELNADDAIYNLQGVKVNSTNNKGVYIKNGQKTVVK